MKLKFLPSVLSAALFLFSCSSVKEASTPSNVVTSKSGDYYTLDITTKGIYQKPQVADLDVKSERVKASFTYENESSDEAKKLAKGDFIKQQKCDVIVEPLLYLTTETSEEITRVTVTISGYPALYKNIHNYELSDSVYFKKYRYMNW